MSATYAISHIVGSSEDSIEDAIRSALATSAASLRNMEWFEVGQIRGHIVGDRVGHYQVELRIGFRYEKE
jgi:flavin-binding protein dodecin